MVKDMRLWRAEGPLNGVRRSGGEARELLRQAVHPPEVHLFPRADGPGSSQDLPQFAAMGHRFPPAPVALDDPAWRWSAGCLRTPGACLDGEPIVFRAVPSDDPTAVEYHAPDFHDRPQSIRPPVPGQPELFVLNILQQFGLAGVRIEAAPMPAVYRGTGLGGSNLAHVGALILASALAGVDLNLGQIYIAASQLENQFGVRLDSAGRIDYGVSLTGGQEALTALQGGWWDNVHLPGHFGPFAVVSRPLLAEEYYAEAGRHCLLVNVGRRREKGVTSSAINNVFMSRWRDADGARLHLEKPVLAYRSAEAIRARDWAAVAAAVARYREIRTMLCADYVVGQEELAQWSLEVGAEYFPLGAGTGTCLVVAGDAAGLEALADHFRTTADPRRGRTVLPFRLRRQGMECRNFAPLGLAEPALVGGLNLSGGMS